MDRQELISPVDAAAFQTLTRERLDACRGLLASILELEGDDPVRSVENTLRPLNELWIELGELHRAIGLLRNVHPDASTRKTAEECEKEVVRFKTEIGLNRPLYDAASACSPDELDAPACRMLEHLLRDFRRSGVDRDDKVRAEVKRLNNEMVALRQEFDRNISTDVREVILDDVSELEGLPADYIHRHEVRRDAEGGDGKIRVTTDYPDYNPFMTYARSARCREELYRAFRSRAHPQNLAVLQSILHLRHELSSLLGYDHWADYVTEDKMIRNAGSADEFIERVAEAARERSVKEYETLFERKRQDDPDADQVFDWEKGYYEQIVRNERFDVDARELRSYLQYDAVKEGVLGIASELFSVEFRVVDDAPTWHEDVETLDVIETGEVVGRVYLDMHPREGKFKHAAMFPLVLGVRGSRRPAAALVCNFPNPREVHGPALLEHDDVVTFFHEFGHLLHHLFARDHEWVEFSGTGTEWDFVEVPSQLFENWAWDPKVVRRFAHHHETGETVPEELVKRLRDAREFGRGLQVRQQMYYASLSLRCHDTDPEELDVEALQQDLQNRFSRFRFVAGTHFLASFGHLNGYSALYYTYMWSLVIEKDLCSVFHANGLMGRDTARRYRDSILAPGGSRDAMDLVREFLGRDYDFDAFHSWLDSGVDAAV